MKYLVDTSVWIDHLHRTNPRLQASLAKNAVVTHPMLLGELACGNMQNRQAFLRHMHELPRIIPAQDNDVLSLIENRRLWGQGLNWIDLHLLMACLISQARLWTNDKKLHGIAADLDVAFIA